MKFFRPSEIARLKQEASDFYGVTAGQMDTLSSYFLAKFIKATKAKKVLILSGNREKGKLGSTAKIHLSNWGVDCTVFNAKTSIDKLKFWEFDLIVDCLIGIEENPENEEFQELIRMVNSTTIPTISADIPSGYDSENGKAGKNCINADEVICFGIPKFGLDKLNCGIYLSYAGIPSEMAKKHGIENPTNGLLLIK